MRCKCGCEDFRRNSERYEEGYIVEYNEICTCCGNLIANCSYGCYEVYEDNLAPEPQEYEITLNFVDGTNHTLYITAESEEEALEEAKDIHFYVNT